MIEHVVLYQHGLYDPEKLERELDRFFKLAEKHVCEAVRRNGGICFQEYAKEYGWKDALELIRSDIENFEALGKTGKFIAQLLRLSVELANAPSMSLKKKILLFDKVIHAVHAAGAFMDELGFEKASIFGLDIPKIKREVEKELERKLLRLTR